jgi:hypothetical protein
MTAKARNEIESQPMTETRVKNQGSSDSPAVLATRLVEQQSLSHHRAEVPLLPREAAELMVNVAEAIE